MADAPVVQIWASSKIHKEERSCVGKWDMRSLITSSSELCGLEKSSEVPRHVKYSFRNPVRCRMIWITLRLQKVGSSSVNFEKDFSRLSLEENPFSEPVRRASFGEPVESDPGPPLNRFKVPIEVERLTDNDLVLEQFLPPVSPMLAAVLYIQVAAFQEPHTMVTVAECRLPEVKVGTAMYFDFPNQISTRRMSFRLLGDVGAFTDDPSEKDDSDGRVRIVAAGLSLANRIKLYYYADP
ncbi:hypothetical protein FXO38_15735 [Capsicum annuum]|nr:hypothetical protein FXO38_15735 [Capsicum annuum]